MIALLITWLTTSIIAILPMAATWRWLRQHDHNDASELIIIPLLISGLLGYATFFAFLLNPLLGKIVSVSLGILLPVLILAKTTRTRISQPPYSWPLLIVWMSGCGLIYLCLLYLPALPWAPEQQSAFRFIDGLPEDATIPQTLADRLYSARPIKPFIIDWLSSDRPPLETGIYLQIRSCLTLLPLDNGLLYQCVGTWTQLFWIPAVWLVCQRLKLSGMRTTCVLGLVACTGFTLLNSTYVWPKLLAGAYGLLTGVILIDTNKPLQPRLFVLAAVSAALGWLAHGGVMFSLLALLPLIALRSGFFRQWRGIACGGTAFILVATPWLAYQKYYDPPGNRLLKWHLAGVRDLDARPFSQTLHESYAALESADWLENKSANLQRVFSGDFSPLADFISPSARPRRTDEFFHVFRALGVLNIGWLLLPWLFFYGHRIDLPLAARLAAWLIVTLAVWILLMFEPGSTVIHQGSYTMMLTALLLTATAVTAIHPIAAMAIAAWHLVYFLATWPPYFGSAPLRLEMLAGAMIGLIAIGAAIIRTHRSGLPATGVSGTS